MLATKTLKNRTGGPSMREQVLPAVDGRETRKYEQRDEDCGGKRIEPQGNPPERNVPGESKLRGNRSQQPPHGGNRSDSAAPHCSKGADGSAQASPRAGEQRENAAANE